MLVGLMISWGLWYHNIYSILFQDTLARLMNCGHQSYGFSLVKLEFGHPIDKDFIRNETSKP